MKRAKKKPAKKPDARRRAFEEMRSSSERRIARELGAAARAKGPGRLTKAERMAIERAARDMAADPRQLEIPGAARVADLVARGLPGACLDCEHADCPIVPDCSGCPTCVAELAAREARAADVRTHSSSAAAAVAPLPLLNGHRKSEPLTRVRDPFGWTRNAPKAGRMNIRLEPAERELWAHAARAGGYRSVSDWMRATCNAAANDDAKINSASPGASAKTSKRRR